MPAATTQALVLPSLWLSFKQLYRAAAASPFPLSFSRLNKSPWQGHLRIPGCPPLFLTPKSEDAQTRSATPELRALQEWRAETTGTKERFSPNPGGSTSLVAFPTTKIQSLHGLTQCCSVLESGVNSALKRNICSSSSFGILNKGN